MPESTHILGVDPGTAITGFGVIESSARGNSLKVVDYGFIATDKGLPASTRLKFIFEDLKKVIEKFAPQEIAVEELFFNKNSKTAIAVGEARGIVLLCAALYQVPVYEYTPLEVKQSIVGYGRATKNQVIYMVRQILNIEEEINPDDVADALAVAICHAFRSGCRGNVRLS
ncbi:MAG TPA: crossover junction endodeoxyribonuclease RuvC [Candidatus Atribacteria bacterium]|nr:crossover junction endodeoxyribonuclease RuvC [Atribacterota bacterium]HOQ50655.1 crossover junction endodeoxyribonuclease RuvC [Candidatus Atribacteria bacterium]HPT63313.1 crossover junction endodeoxyribonuclease RuvC [Candidatus Atribacteria bacterium]HQD33474.1 crossover junction endodeoxyribonuclease RuvC [Candidatus Atribacteria bacterium]